MSIDKTTALLCLACGASFGKRAGGSNRYCRIECYWAHRVTPAGDEIKFCRNSRVDASGCWIWLKALDADGYGHFGRPRQPAHAWSHRHFIGPIPEGLVIDHLCRNRACVNPTHLECVTNEVNNARGNSPTALNARKEFCANGHPFAGDNLKLKPNKRTTTGIERVCRTCDQNRSVSERRARGVREYPGATVKREINQCVMLAASSSTEA